MSRFRRNYSLKLIFYIVIAFSFFSRFNHPVYGLAKLHPGLQEFQISIHANYPPNEVKAILYIPHYRNTNTPLPLLTYFHGASSNPDEYQNLGQLTGWAEGKGFLLLSIQNRWALNAQLGAGKGILDSLNAASGLIERLPEYCAFDSKRIYATGFSGGGLVALCAGFYRPDLFAGVGDFKGNFYQSAFETVLDSVKTQPSFNPSKWNNLKIFICLGGPNDAPRVLKQVPEALDYLRNNLRISPIYQQYPGEGHFLSKRDFEDFWESVVR